MQVFTEDTYSDVECLILTSGTLILRFHLQIPLRGIRLADKQPLPWIPTPGKSVKNLGLSKYAFATLRIRITARECGWSCWIRTSFLLSQVGHVSKLPRLYLGERPRWCTTAPSDPFDASLFTFLALRTVAKNTPADWHAILGASFDMLAFFHSIVSPRLVMAGRL